MAKKAKSTLGKWISRIRVGAATVLVRGKTKKAAKANAARFVRKHMKNIEKNPNYMLRAGTENLSGLYSNWVSAKLAARKESRRLGKKVRVVKSRN